MKRGFSPGFAFASLVLAVALALTALPARAQFHRGNLVLVRLGDGVQVLTNAGNTVFLEERTIAGALVGVPLQIPDSGNSALIESGAATSEGALSLSGDGRFLTIAGYNTTRPFLNVAASPSATVPRVIGLINVNKGFSLAATTPTAFSANNIRSGVTDGANNFWGAGASSGTYYFGSNGPAGTVQTNVTNTRVIQDLGGSLYFSSSSGAFLGVSKIPGTPISGTSTATLLLPGGAGSSAYDFAFNPAFTIAYVADDRANASGGIQRFSFNGSTWSSNYTLGTGVTNVGARGLAVDFSGANPIVYATTAEGTLNRLIKITDTGFGSPAITLAVAPANQIFRGLEFAPTVPIVLSCSSNLTVTASGPGGAVVTYASSASGGCSPPIVVCNPPSGSTFPIGTTIVTCTASDACGTVATCSFTVTVLPATAVGTEYFFGSPILPPAGSMYISPAVWHQLYANGIVIRDVRHRFFTQGLEPPPLGGTQVHTFDSEVDFEVSLDNGATFQAATGNATVTVRVTHTLDSNGIGSYDTEMEQLDFTAAASGLTLMLRESPTLHSTGQTTVRPVSGGYMISSFFDIWTELSLDGNSWSPAQQAGHVELRPDPTQVAGVGEPTSLLPPPNDVYVSPARWHALFAQGIVIKDVRHKFFAGSLFPPSTGQSNLHSFNSVLDLQVSMNGGQSFQYVRASGLVQVGVVNASSASDNSLYDTEMKLLNVTLPSGAMLRESPTEPSRGITQVDPLADGTFRVTSFFDIFPEVSLDGGASWQPATNGPVRMQLVSQAPENPPTPTPNLPPVVGQYVSPQQWHAFYANGIIITNVSHSLFTQSFPPPPPGGSQTHSFNSAVEGQISLNGGKGFQSFLAPASVTVVVSNRADLAAGGTSFFDTEMLSLSISGGSLPGGVMLRESPSKASLGRTSTRQAPTDGLFRISSFFDVFTELSLDGGQSWSPLTNFPGTVALRPPTNNPVEVDTFPNTVAELTLQYPGGETEVVTLTGPTTVHVLIGPDGRAGDKDGNGLDQVDTEMVQLDLSGSSAMGPITANLAPSQRSLGQIEETVNNTPGLLDLPPFAPTGTANSFFDVFVQLQIGGQTLHPAQPLHMTSLIRHKPPAPGDTYVNPFTLPVPLLDANGNPTGIRVLREVHTPTPTNRPPVEVDRFPNTTAQVTLQYPGGQTEVVTLSGPTTVHVNIAPNGQAADTDGNGRDQVTTEMVQLSLVGSSSMGPVTANLDPSHRSLGQIEETVNNTPGILDVPPFTASGTASSFFDVFVQLNVGGQTLHPATPLHMTSVIHHKPPAPGDTYVNPFETPIVLLDANGNPTGYRVLAEVHTPNPTNPPPIEVDYFSNTVAVVTLQYPGGQTEAVTLRGPTTVNVNIAPGGQASDSDGNGRDQVSTEMVQLDLSGISSLGPVTATLDASQRSFGQIEETQNNTPGILDVPPFTPTGTANSFFDVFVELQVAGQTLYPATALHLTSLLHHKPPAPGDAYVNPFTTPIVLLDANGNPTGFRVLAEVHTPNPTNQPPVEVDRFPNTTAEVTLQYPGGQTETVSLSGPTTVHVNIAPTGQATDTDNNGLDQVTTEMVQLDLAGSSSMGPVTVNLDGSHHSLGQIEETVNNTPGILDVPPFTASGTANSFFDVYVQLQVGGQTLHPAAPLHMSSLIHHKPPIPGDVYINPFTTPIALLDANGNPTGIRVLREVHTPNPTNPPVEVDYFPNTTAQVTLQLPGGQTEVVTLNGPTTVEVAVPPNGQASDTDGNGLDQVDTEMVQLDLSGISSLGLVTVNLDPDIPSLGEIEERTNNTPGVLDVPPFTASGSANSFFDVFLELHVGGLALHPATPIHMASVIRHKPPGTGDTYVNPFTTPIVLLDANGNPTGFRVLAEVHTPVPTNPPPVEIDRFPNTTAQVTLQYPGGQTEVVSLNGPTTVRVNIPPGGQAADTDGNGRDQVTTEMVELALTGSSSLGPVSASLDASHRSLGQIEETVNNTPGILDVPPFRPTGTANSFFDVFVLLNVGGQTLHPAAPIHMSSVIHHKPPAPGDVYTNTFLIPVDLLDANGNPTGIKVVREVHTPTPTNPQPVEVDYFSNTVATVTLQYPGGQTEAVTLNGPTTINVHIPPGGQASDSDGNGLDQVDTEMVQLDLSGVSSLGLVTVNLNPAFHSLGEIEETANNTPGILDVPPFRPTGSANSFFDVFVELHVAGLVLHPATPIHMTSVIHHKPPGPGDTYVNPFTTPIPLLDANGNPTGYRVLAEVHTPVPTNPPPVEIDRFPDTTAEVTLQFPGGQSETVSLTGPTTVRVNIPPNGQATDSDGNGLDQVTTEMVQLDLNGSSSMGPVTVHLDPSLRSLGQIEETVNNTPGILDVPPFTATGTANSFFDVYAVLQVGGQTYHPATPLHMQALIRHKPPAPGDVYINPFAAPIQLLDANGNPTGVRLLREVHTPNPTNRPPIEVDYFSDTVAEVTLQYAGGQTEVVRLSGPTTVNVMIPPGGAASDTDGNGLDQVDTEMVQLDLSGASSLGPVTVNLDPGHRTLGEIEETANNTPGVLDIPPFTASGSANSFFDVFIELRVGGQTLHPATPLHMTALITHKPPAPGDTYVNPFTTPVPLLDANGNPTGIKVLREVHVPVPPVEVDHFPNTTAQVTLQYPGGLTEVVALNGPTTVNVFIPPNGQAADSDGDGRDQVNTEMIQLDLTGTSSLGPVSANLDHSHRSFGQIEEQVNNTPGILDVPPFTATGAADSFFDVFVELHVAGQTLHPATPLHMASVIHHKPPRPGDTYVNPFTTPIVLLDANGNPTGFAVLQEVHTPNPTNPPPVEVDHFPNTTAQLILQRPDGQTEQVSLAGPTTVNVNIAPNGAASDTDNNGLDQVTTVMTALNLSGNSSMGPVTVNLDPTHAALGQIEETVNNTPGILDVPPFTATGSANSFFDVFVQVHVGGQTLHAAQPLHMTSLIHHKPPRPGDTYVNPFTTPIVLLDANGNPTGFKVLQEVHTPYPTNPPPVEIDHFPNTTAQITLQYPSGQSEAVSLSGPTTVHVNIPPSGAALDTDGNGLDQVTTEMTDLNLSGASSMGPVTVNLDPLQPSLGQIEEQVNNTPGILDVPPFTATGAANSTFDVFVEIHVGGQTLHPATPLHMSAVIHHKPPEVGAPYINPFTTPIVLLDANGNPTGFKVLREVHTPNPTNPPPVEIDFFPNTTAQLTLEYPNGQIEAVVLSGPTTVHVNIPPSGAAMDTDGNGLDQVSTEMTDLSLTGNSSMGPVTVNLDPAHPTLGQIEEQFNATPGILDVPPFTATGSAESFFDVFAQIHVGGQTYYPATPLHLASVIHHKPPRPGDTYVNPFTTPIQLLDANGNPTGIKVRREVHTPYPTNPPPVEIDHFPITTAQLTLLTPGGQTEVISLAGPTTVHVNIAPNGAALDTDGNGLDQVTTEMTDLSLSGNSSQGPVIVDLDPAHPSLGQIEEVANNTPGILDVPPFTATGSANSFFDVFVQVHVGGQTLHPATPLHLASVIHHKPPSPGDAYVNPFTTPIPLLDANGNPSGFVALQEVHTPNPTNRPPVEADHFPSTTAQLTLQYPGGQTEVVTLVGPTTVHVNIPPNGAALDTDGNGLDQVSTEMTDLSLSGSSSVGPVTVDLDPAHASLGQIEETVNLTPGILDVPPFTASGSANSFFDVFVQVHVGGQILHPATPLHMSSLIHHKPPIPGDDYVNPFTQPIELLDANGNPTGVRVLREVHTPYPTNPPPVEVDYFSNTTAQIELLYPGGQSEQVLLAGPTTVNVFIPPNGAASDLDGNGRDQVRTEMTQLDLSGNSSLGPVTVNLDPANPTLGQIEETVNNTPGTLDVPPFAPSGTANSFFDVFIQLHVGAQVLHPALPLHMAAVITHKPPAPGDTYVNPGTPIDLLDANGNPTGIRIVHQMHTPNPGLQLRCSTNITVTVSNQNSAVVFYTSSATSPCTPVALTCTPASGSVFGLGTTTVTCFASDSCGHSTNCSFLVTVVQQTNPPIALICSTNRTVTATSSNGAIVTYVSSATGGCSPPVVSCNPTSGSVFAVGTTTVTCFASDSCGHSTNCSFLVTVVPQTNPPIVLICSTNRTVTATSSNGAIVFFTSSATGGCSPPVVSCNPTSGSVFAVGTTPVTCLAFDSCGHSTNCSFLVTVVPQTNPPIVLICSTNRTVTATSSNGAIVFFTSSASGGCSPPVVSCNPTSGSTFAVGTTTVTCSAFDSCGHSNNCSFLVTVVPQTNPPVVLICSTNRTVTATSSNGAIVSFTSSASGGCSPPVVSCNPTSGSIFAVGTTTVTCAATDNCGGVTNCSFTITVTRPQADLGITKTATTNAARVGQQLTFNLRLTNAGPATITNTVVISDVLPSGLQYVSDTGTGTNGTYSAGLGQWTVAPGPIGAVNLGITVLATNVGTFTNLALINVPSFINDPNPANNISSAVVSVSATTIPRPTINQIQYLGNHVRLCITNDLAGATYSVQQRSDLNTGTWLTVGTAVPGTGNGICVDITVTAPTRQFYRICAQ